MILLDIYTALTSLYNTNHLSWLFGSSSLIILWNLRGFSVFMIIYFVFKKASKLHIDKNKYIFILKIVFNVSMIFVLFMSIFQLLNANDTSKSYQMYKPFKEKAVLLTQCSNPDEFILTIVTALEIFIFWIFVKNWH